MGRHTEADEVLERGRLARLDGGAQVRDLLLDARVDLLDLELLTADVGAHAALLEVQVEAHARLRARDVLAQALPQLLDVVPEPVRLRLEQRDVVLLEQLQLRLELRDVHLLRVLRLRAVSAARLTAAHKRGRTLPCADLVTMLPVIFRTLSSTTSAIAVMIPSACARFRPSRSSRCTKWCVSKWKSPRAALLANVRASRVRSGEIEESMGKE
jgi:hypothetical protein